MPSVKLIAAPAFPMKILKTAAGQCYQKEATDKVIEHIVDAGHLSVLEHCYATFEVTCSLAVLLQLTRHRHLSFTVQSSRGSELTGLYECEHEAINEMNRLTMEAYHLESKMKRTPQEVLQYALPKAVEYKLVVSGNFRAWFEYLPKRLCKRASKEHRELAELILHALRANCPEVFLKCGTPCVTCKEKGCSYSG